MSSFSLLFVSICSRKLTIFFVILSRQASVQIENLQEQLQAFAAQRDRAVMDLALSQEKVDQYQTSLNNLQLVLEQFQKGKIVQTVKLLSF